jgi:phage terminase large subunit GpA-like protein
VDDRRLGEQVDWLEEKLKALTTTIAQRSPSECVEELRYLPAHNTSRPGFFRYDRTPYLREIVDNFDVRSPVTHVDVMKGVQVAYTTGVLESALFYAIVEVKTAPVMLTTSTDDLARKRLDNFVIPMLQASDVDDLVRSNDESNRRKTGRSALKVGWDGGGVLVATGAQSPNAARSLPIRFFLGDETDSWPLVIGKDGDSVQVFEGRTKSFPNTKKVARGSTPLLLQSSLIHREYLQGDQRKYYVKCLGCGEHQEIRWKLEDPNTGKVSGICDSWELDGNGRLVPDTVAWVCKCGHRHSNDDKARLLSEDYGAEWVPTAVPEHPNRRSYHIPALISPPGMQTWEDCARDWLRAWDPASNRPKDMQKLQAFYNLILGVPFEDPSTRKLTLETVSPHRRSYLSGEVPNKWLVERATGHPVGLVLCTVDVHGEWLAVATWGFTRGERMVLVEYQRFPESGTGGDAENEHDPLTWGALSDYICNRKFVSDDGKEYPISVTAIDAGYLPDQVYQFVHEHSATVALLGRVFKGKQLSFKYFSESDNALGVPSFIVHVDGYKSRISANLQCTWDGTGFQPNKHFNAPRDITDSQLKELTVEKKTEIVGPNGEHQGWTWHRPSGSRNELFDLSVYACAILDIVALENCPVSKRDGTFLLNYSEFWDICEGQGEFLPRYYSQT